ncbi:MAG: hypothetical protein ACKPFK_05660, partial [Dolichospermum sp.]
VVLGKILDKLKINNKLALIFNPSYRQFASLDIDLLHVPYQTPPIYDLPYPVLSDPVNVSGDIQSLAEQIACEGLTLANISGPPRAISMTCSM